MGYRYGVEVYQWYMELFGISDGNSGAPFGGNEDMGSNADGADYGDEHHADDKPLGDQVSEYMDKQRGGVSGVTSPSGAGGGR